MKPRLVHLYSVDVSGELPADPTDCWVVVQAEIGLEGEEGADLFTFYVCTVTKLRAVLRAEGCLVGRHLLLLERFDWERVERAITRIIDKTEGDTWEEIAGKIGRFGLWEFEDYVEPTT